MLEVLGLRRAIVSVPFPLAAALAAATGWLPMAPLTPEEVRLLRTDKVAGELPTPAASASRHGRFPRGYRPRSARCAEAATGSGRWTLTVHPIDPSALGQMSPMCFRYGKLPWLEDERSTRR